MRTVPIALSERESRTSFPKVIQWRLEILPRRGRFQRQPESLWQILPHTWSHGEGMTQRLDCLPVGFGNGQVHNLVLEEILGGERAFPRSAEFLFKLCLAEGRAFGVGDGKKAVHVAGGEEAELGTDGGDAKHDDFAPGGKKRAAFRFIVRQKNVVLVAAAAAH